MTAAGAGKPIPEVGIGMLGYAFMGKAHTNAFKTLPYMMYPPPAIPRLAAICGLGEAQVAEAAQRYGYEAHYTDWRKMLEDERVQLFDNGGSNDIHAEPTILAAQMGKHVICEKPLARNAEEAKSMLDAVTKAGVKHMVGFNYRFVPAVRLARELIQSGKLGRIYHFRAVYLQEWLLPHYDLPFVWRMDRKLAGSGALGDLGAHTIDLARHLLGEVKTVSALTHTFVPERRLPVGSGSGIVSVDDAYASLVEFHNGAIGTIEASRFATGNRNRNSFEINGERGSIRFDLQQLNELQVYFVDDPAETQGFRAVSVTESVHPWMSNWWPHGHIIGWEHTFVHEMAHLLDCIVNDKDIAPLGATFEDGYINAVICDAILKSAETKRQVDVPYRDIHVAQTKAT
jgi:predicted dehydrogenase